MGKQRKEGEEIFWQRGAKECHRLTEDVRTTSTSGADVSSKKNHRNSLQAKESVIRIPFEIVL